MAAEPKLVPSGVFVNDLNTPSAREKPPVVNKTQAEETEHAEKAEHAPADLAPTKHPGAHTAWPPVSPIKAKQTTRTGEPTYWLTSSTKSSLRNATQLTGSPNEPKRLPWSTASSTSAAPQKLAFS
jgi:hypothetical protein